MTSTTTAPWHRPAATVYLAQGKGKGLATAHIAQKLYGGIAIPTTGFILDFDVVGPDSSTVRIGILLMSPWTRNLRKRLIMAFRQTQRCVPSYGLIRIKLGHRICEVVDADLELTIVGTKYSTIIDPHFGQAHLSATLNILLNLGLIHTKLDSRHVLHYISIFQVF
jgi:hypothetical protein